MNIMKSISLLLSGIAGGLAWWLGMVLIFGSVQFILADPSLQSAKFDAVFQSFAPLPRSTTAPWIMPLGLLFFGFVDACVYAIIRSALGGTVLKRGAGFGLILWLIMAPWFEFYLPWNVMWEPAKLVALELLCWLGVMQMVGQTIAQVQERLLIRRKG
jgi:hypothetical protein